MPGRPADSFNDFFTSEPQEKISYHKIPRSRKSGLLQKEKQVRR